MEYMLIPAYYEKEVILSDNILTHIKDAKKIALFASVQFIKLDTVEEQLKKAGHEILQTHGKRTSGKYQILGCDCFSNAFEDTDIFKKADAILYIGDGLFHPKALVLAQRGLANPKDVILYDPVGDKITNLTATDLEKQTKRYKANILKYMHAETVGVLVSTKTGQQYLKNAMKLKEQTKDKNVYIFVGDTLDNYQMENYPFIEVWINSACPRIGYDDVEHIVKPIVNINDAFDPAKALERLG